MRKMPMISAESAKTVEGIWRVLRDNQGQCFQCLNPKGRCQQMTDDGWIYCPIKALANIAGGIEK